MTAGDWIESVCTDGEISKAAGLNDFMAHPWRSFSMKTILPTSEHLGCLYFVVIP